MTRIEREVGEFFKSLVPSLIVSVYGILLLVFLGLIFFLMKEDLTLLQQTLNKRLGIDGILLKFNINSFDEHFNKYASKLIE